MFCAHLWNRTTSGQVSICMPFSFRSTIPVPDAQNIRQTNNHVNLHTHRGVQDATLEIFKSYLFANFSVFTDFHFTLHPHRIVHFLTSGLLHHAVLVKVDGLEPPLTEPKSIVLPLHHTSLGEGVYPPMLALLGGTLLEVFLRYFHVLWAGLEPAFTSKSYPNLFAEGLEPTSLYFASSTSRLTDACYHYTMLLRLKVCASTNSATKASVGHFPMLLNN